MPVFWHTTIDQDRPVGSKATFSEHVHDFYHIVLYTRGHGWYRIHGNYRPASAGTCVLVHPGQRHDFISRRETAVYSELTFSYQTAQEKHLTISFLNLLMRYAGFDMLLDKEVQLRPESAQVLQNLLIQITDYLNSGRDVSTYYAHRTLAHIFDFLIEYCTRHQSPEVIDDRFVRARMWIEEHYLEKLSMDQLASQTGVSKGYFFRAFKKAFGLPPLAYQQKLRIEAAKTLLKATSLQCNEIAFRAGFSDAYFFHRLFKKQLGMTPVQYRKSQA